MLSWWEGEGLSESCCRYSRVVLMLPESLFPSAQRVRSRSTSAAFIRELPGAFSGTQTGPVSSPRSGGCAETCV